VKCGETHDTVYLEVYRFQTACILDNGENKVPKFSMVYLCSGTRSLSIGYV
jgi:hypothetical protein